LAKDLTVLAERFTQLAAVADHLVLMEVAGDLLAALAVVTAAAEELERR
jgi:hypothetical protein